MLKNRFFKNIAAVFFIFTSVAATVIPASTCTTYAADTSKASEALWPEAPELTSESVILIDADTGAILYEKDSHLKAYPASTTKILTGLLTIENCSMDEIVTFSRAAANSYDLNDANVGTRTGEQFTVEQCLYALLLHSANEMGYGLAEHVSGSVEAFTELMNERARECGALNTHFANASGLFDENHYTTAYDMAMIARDCYNNPTFVNIDSTYTTYTIPETNVTKEKRYIRHRHSMLKNRAYYYEYCTGGKTGYTSESGYTLVTFAEKDNMRLICVCFKSGADSRFTDTRTLFDWGFQNFKKITTSASAVSSLFSSDSYYCSRVFNNYTYRFKLNASTLTIPANAALNNISLNINDTLGSSVTDNVYTANLNFKCEDNIVGTAKLTLSNDTGSDRIANLPYLDDGTASEIPATKKCFVINIWIIAGAAALILAVIHIKSELERSRRQARRYSNIRRNSTRIYSQKPKGHR